MKGPSLVLTGERTLPGIWHENYWFRRHESVYAAAREWVAGAMTIVDAGCGEGYGAAFLRDDGREVVALDYDADAVAHAYRSYAVPAARANLVAIPIASTSVDAVVSLQVVEHLWDQQRFVAECARVLRPGGVLVLSTPNRVTFSPGVARGEKPLNPFHVNEYDAEELRDLLAPQFATVAVRGLEHGPRLGDWELAHGDVVAAQLAGPLETWSPEVTAVVASLGVDDFAITEHAHDDCLDLIAVARSST